MPGMIQVFRAFDRSVQGEVQADDAASLEAKLAKAAALLRDRGTWLKPYERAAILQRAAVLLDARVDVFAG